MNRVILHLDFDYFYAQLEELRKPELKGKPVAIGMFSGRTEYSGAIATANYAAREFGIRAGMPIAFARSKAKELVLLKADRPYYEEVSNRLMELLRKHCDKFEQVSIDEAYLDITERAKSSYVEGKKIGEKIKKQIKEEEKLTCSIGIGSNKLIAKMASSVKKPDGLTVITPSEIKDFLRGRRIKDLHGIGPKTVELLAEKGITTIPKLAEVPASELQEWFGENRGILIHEKSIGFDESEVEERERQQYSRIKTLKEDTSSAERLLEESGTIASELAELSAKKKIYFKTVSIIVVSNKMETITRSRTIEQRSQNAVDILSTAGELFRQFFSEKTGFQARRFGITISNFSGKETQKTLLDF